MRKMDSLMIQIEDLQHKKSVCESERDKFQHQVDAQSKVLANTELELQQSRLECKRLENQRIEGKDMKEWVNLCKDLQKTIEEQSLIPSDSFSLAQHEVSPSSETHPLDRVEQESSKMSVGRVLTSTTPELKPLTLRRLTIPNF